jgi:hypothetical protein
VSSRPHLSGFAAAFALPTCRVSVAHLLLICCSPLLIGAFPFVSIVVLLRIVPLRALPLRCIDKASRMLQRDSSCMRASASIDSRTLHPSGTCTPCR